MLKTCLQTILGTAILAAVPFTSLAGSTDINTTSARVTPIKEVSPKEVHRGVEVVVNDMTMHTDVFRVYARPANSNGNWGIDRLGQHVLEPGDTLDFRLPTGRYDFCVELTDTNGGDLYHYMWQGVNVGDNGYSFNITNEWDAGTSSSGGCVSSAAPVMRHTLNIRDRTQETELYRIYVRPASSGNWGEDRLGSRILDPGESLPVQVEAGRYDVCVEVRHQSYWDPSDEPRSIVWRDVAINADYTINVNEDLNYGNQVYNYGYCTDR
jgi:hypothetical protein